MEYSIQRDAVFCYPCRKFAVSNTTDNTFTILGYNNWKHAKEKGKGFNRHESSSVHMECMQKWQEKLNRINTNTEISELLSANILEGRRYYMKAVIETITLLIKNGLPLRGSYITEEDNITGENGLFTEIFGHIKLKYKELIKCEKYMPSKYTYTSPGIQNEIISILAEMVRESIAKDINKADVNFFTLLADGTKDKRNRKCVSIGARYVKNGKPIESIISMENFEELNAEYFVKKTLSLLEKYGLNNTRILSQCYDGANVISGEEGGVQGLINKQLKRVIPYVHCFNHRFHLVVIETIKIVVAVRQFFDQIPYIINFFKRFKIQKLYDGSAILKLIETRWAGHVRSINSIYLNYPEIVSTLPQVKGKNFDGDDIAEATGILKIMKSLQFVFILVLMEKILQLLSPVDKILQSREIGYRESMPVIQSVLIEIDKLRNDEEYKKVYEAANKLLEQAGIEPISNRNRQSSKRLRDYVITERTGERSDETIELQSIYYEVIDVIKSETNRRFTENDIILKAISASYEMDLSLLKPLEKLGLKLPSESELSIAKRYIIEEKEKAKNNKVNIFEKLYTVKVAFPDTYDLFAAIETFGSSTSVCESSFTALTRIERPQRLSMTSTRLNNLAYLTFVRLRGIM